jgi:hypothetical protein
MSVDVADLVAKLGLDATLFSAGLAGLSMRWTPKGP